MSNTMRDAAKIEASALYESEDTYNHPEEVMAKAFERGAAWQAAQSQPAPPVPASVQEIMRLMMPYVRACVRFNDAVNIEIAEAEVKSAFKPLEAALVALVDDNHRLKFELAGVNAMRGPEWQPIETAPKDGTNVLLINDKSNIAAGLWLAGILGTGWFLRGGNKPDYFFNGHRGPTHWMPLPPPPTHGIEPEQGDVK